MQTDLWMFWQIHFQVFTSIGVIFQFVSCHSGASATRSMHYVQFQNLVELAAIQLTCYVEGMYQFLLVYRVFVSLMKRYPIILLPKLDILM